MNLKLENIKLDINGANIAGIRQRNPADKDQERMLCVHGWLDNANSFVPLMPYLPAFDLVAIDLPGHGYSDHLSSGYALHEISFVLHEVLTALGWDKCHLVGHSLGGGLLSILSVTQPAYAQSLTIIDSVGTLSETADKLPKRMQKAFQDRIDSQRFESRVFKGKQAAIDSRLKAATMHVSSAKLIIDRQLRNDDDGWRWRFDKRWRFASSQYLTDEQVIAILQAIKCPVLAVLADDGLLARYTLAQTQQRLASLNDHELVQLPGHHHVHMDTPEPVASAINRFLKATPALGG